jgi:uncharacterized protein
MSFTLNLGFGLGLRAPHRGEIQAERPARLGWLELLSENYLNAPEATLAQLHSLRQDYPMVLHGVSLSIGSTDPLDEDYLARLRMLADALEVALVSDHLCFTGILRQNTHDLLPIPYTEEALAHLIPRIARAQEALARPLVLENPSTYLEFQGSTIPEAELFAELHARTGCQMLLDVNNVYVSSFNHGWEATRYIDALPGKAIVQYHLAGHTNKGEHLIDTHDATVADPVWDLFRYTLKCHGPRSTMIEWDANIPPLATVLMELEKARAVAT